MKIGISSYSFSQLIQKGEMTQADCVSQAKALGFDAIEFAELQPYDQRPSLAYARELKELAQKENIPIVNFAFGADFLTGSGGDLKKEIRRVMDQIDLAAELGVPLIRHDCTTGQGASSFEAVLPRLAAACREITVYAAGKGIKTTVENHGYFCQDSRRMEQLHTAVDHKNFGLLVDIGNFLCVEEDSLAAVSRLAPLAFHVHAKDFLFRSGPVTEEGFFPTRGGNSLCGTILGDGCVPVSAALTLLKNAGYRGAVSLEFEGREDCLSALSTGLKRLKEYSASL